MKNKERQELTQQLVNILQDMDRYANVVPNAQGNTDPMRLMGRFFWMAKTSRAALLMAEELKRSYGKKQI